MNHNLVVGNCCITCSFINNVRENFRIIMVITIILEEGPLIMFTHNHRDFVNGTNNNGNGNGNGNKTEW